MNKLIGFSPIYNEIECVRGWCENMLAVCDEVTALYDPRSNDGTLDILKEYNQLYSNRFFIQFQDIHKGDSIRDKKGEKGDITFLHAVNSFLESLPEDTWCMWLASDERVNPKEIKLIRGLLDSLIEINKKGNWNQLDKFNQKPYDSIVFNFIDICDEENSLKYGWDHLKSLNLTHRKIFQSHIRVNTGAHSGYREFRNWYRSEIPFYHFGHVKKNMPNCFWHKDNDQRKDAVQFLERIPENLRKIYTHIPFKDWRNK